MNKIATTPTPPYYAVIFTSITSDNLEDYSTTAQRMLELAHQQDGFLGVESVREDIGITVSYWKDLESIKKWKNNIEHVEARKKGYSQWYKSCKTRISKVEREYGF